MKIKKYKLEKVFLEEVDFKLPTTELFLFEYHVRRSVRVTPIYTTWYINQQNRPEELYELVFTIVTDRFNSDSSKITQRNIPLSKFEEIYSNRSKNQFDFDLLDFVETYDVNNIRTKEQYESDFNKILNLLQCPIN